MSFGRSDLMLRNSLVRTPMIAAGLFIGANYGIEGAAMGYAIAASASYAALTMLACKQLHASITDYLSGFVPWLISASIMAISIITISFFYMTYLLGYALLYAYFQAFPFTLACFSFFFRRTTLILFRDILSRLNA